MCEIFIVVSYLLITSYALINILLTWGSKAITIGINVANRSIPGEI